jgi:hypothetical protein
VQWNNVCRLNAVGWHCWNTGNKARQIMASPREQRAIDTLLMALACGATVPQAAAKAGVSERTVYRRLARPAFREKLDKLRADMVQRTSAMLTAAAMEAVKTLVELQNPAQPPGVRLRAACAILELGMKLRSDNELEARIRALEERAQAMTEQAA